MFEWGLWYFSTSYWWCYYCLLFYFSRAFKLNMHLFGEYMKKNIKALASVVHLQFIQQLAIVLVLNTYSHIRTFLFSMHENTPVPGFKKESVLNFFWKLHHLVPSRKPGAMNLLVLCIYVKENFKRCHIINSFVQMRMVFSKTTTSKCYRAESMLQVRNSHQGLWGYLSQALPLHGFMGVPGHFQNHDWSQPCKTMIRRFAQI